MDVNLIDEAHPGKIAAVFNNETDARAAEKALLQSGFFSQDVINIIQPNDANLSHKIEPDSPGIAGTILKSHGVLGVVGLLAGLILASILITAGPTFTESNPGATYFALGFVGLMIGMMIAGAISLRPDHDPLITETVEASADNKWTIVVQAENRDGVNQAKQILSSRAVSITETI
ncbi:hypothetical protein Q7C_2623 [Methylophaga frappieri]|uniref:Transmembrane protein n=1 Tax=Methylophaga frappieri (strain ATCC BAA-2434 / DSM 25690 / JAM7) TaxID=754477 RepID=I1YLF1_METFJ|nr:hypothetical protein [Methylophaga frappieri]AFJ03744.1 hypothetical protein Q7C_2623 [Methylophaga frappieri]